MNREEGKEDEKRGGGKGRGRGRGKNSMCGTVESK